MNAVDCAIEKSHSDIASILIQAGAKPAKKKVEGHAAALEGQGELWHDMTDICSLAMDERDARGWTPLHRATLSGDAGLVEKLLRVKADANVGTLFTAETALHLVAQAGHVAVAQLLI